MQRYSFDHITRAGVIMLIVMCLMGVVGASLFIWFSSEPSHKLIIFIPIIIGLIVVAGWLVLYHLRMHDSIVVTDAGLTYEPASGQPQVVPWHQITTLVPHSLRGRYDVLDEHNRCVMYVYYDLENFLELDARLREHFRQRSPDGRTTFTIHRAGSKIAFTVGVCCALPFLSTLVFPANELDLMGIVLTCASPPVISWRLYGTVEQIVITNVGLLIEYWKRTALVPFSAIQGVTLQDGTLSIHRRDQKLFTLQSKWAHPLMPILQKAIETAWKQAMSRQKPL
ncbi:MAG: hypothetical protein OEY77_10145 [Nitrospira sp.]|nr:hypothetical protein [Nitrospira sp.]